MRHIGVDHFHAEGGNQECEHARIVLARPAKGNIIEAMNVRPYEPRDRAALREIACDTADSGNPVERFFPDREVFADALTRYYTDIAPEATWIAEDGGKVIGYLTGCLDTRRYLRAMAFRIGPAAFLKALVRGTLWHPLTRRLLRANCRASGPLANSDCAPTAASEAACPTPSRFLDNYPAHVHINLRHTARGGGVGEQLLEAFLRQAKEAGIAGVHANVSEGNAGGRKFFEKFGFVPLGRENRFRFPDAPETPTFTILYGKRLFR
jgi:GNAT superfamily N-acetyltransferase